MSEEKQRVENELFLVRESSSGAILNTDISAYTAILENKKRKKMQSDMLLNEIQELRNMVKALTERIT